MRHLFISVCFLLLAGASTAQVQTFPLSSVQLLDGPFKDAQQTDLKYILEMDVDRLLAPFLKEAGITPLKSNYGNWENTGLDGHIGGHYLSALANMDAATGDPEVHRRLNYMIDWIDSCQRKNGNGYISGVPNGKIIWNEIAQGKINANAFGLNNRWVPLYNIHKLFAGLRDAYLVAGIEKARPMLISLADWFMQTTGGLTDEQIQDMLRSEHGGINEIFADVSAITGDRKYLDIAKRLSHRRLLNPLLQNKDSLTGMHANTQIPKVVGFQRIALLNGDQEWFRAALSFWRTVVGNRSVSIGGNSVREHFHPATDFSSMINDVQGPETCNTYNMLRLSEKLFQFIPDADFMDYYEKALYNHILSSQHPNGGFVYFTPMRPQHYRVYSQPQESFWCCVGSGIENHGKYGEMIYAHFDDQLFINLFIPSKLEWKEKGVTVVQETKFPTEETTTLKFKVKQPQYLVVFIRLPEWSSIEQMEIMVNNKRWQIISRINGFIKVDRTWNDGDVVSVRFPMHAELQYLPDGSPWASFAYGPIVLGAITDTANLAGLKADDSRMGHVANGPLYPINTAPIIISSRKDKGIKLTPVKGKPLTFTAASMIYPSSKSNLVLQPFYTIHDARYMLYWRVADKKDLPKIRQELNESEKQRMVLEEITVDRIAPGEQQPEVEHQFKGERTDAGTWNDWHWRNTTAWFSYQLENKSNTGKKIRVTYNGKDKGSIDIYANNILLATETIDGSKGDTLFTVDYTLPGEVLNSHKPFELKFSAKNGARTPRVFYIRLIK